MECLVQFVVVVDAPCCLGIDQIMRFAENVVVRTEEDGHAVCRCFDRVMDSFSESAADVCHVSESVD